MRIVHRHGRRRTEPAAAPRHGTRVDNRQCKGVASSAGCASGANMSRSSVRNLAGGDGWAHELQRPPECPPSAMAVVDCDELKTASAMDVELGPFLLP